MASKFHIHVLFSFLSISMDFILICVFPFLFQVMANVVVVCLKIMYPNQVFSFVSLALFLSLSLDWVALFCKNYYCAELAATMHIIYS